MIDSLLSLENVSVEFRARTSLFRSVPIYALNDISLDLTPGETMAIVGESGSGKTTLGRVCLRLLEPTHGKITFSGENVSKMSSKDLKKMRRRAQAIFQDPFSSIDPFMTVKQIVEEPLIIHGYKNKTNTMPNRTEIVEWALEEVKLAPTKTMLNKYPHTLSGGQRQRVAIARAIVLNPELIIADEPVSMIDASSRLELLYLLSEIQAHHNTTFLYITHDIATTRHFSNRIAIMYMGHIVESGSTSHVIDNPLHPYTQSLLKAVPEPNPMNRFKARGSSRGELPSIVNPPTGCHFHPRCDYFKPGQCDQITPLKVAVKPGHLTMCHLWKKPTTNPRLPQ